ncbi:hypothetical protein [Helicobacter suis]|uniref:hypothetical protein n=1 Tax=Helicobacter suis TaxID=104628 RepID=UPI000CF01C3D|nr:hypothetical protein [Helicobacter suis]
MRTPLTISLLSVCALQGGEILNTGETCPAHIQSPEEIAQDKKNDATHINNEGFKLYKEASSKKDKALYLNARKTPSFRAEM